MSMSSGIRVYDVERVMTCGAQIEAEFTFGLVTQVCTFEGVVEVGIDPEISVAMWVCPECATEHPVEWGDQ